MFGNTALQHGELDGSKDYLSGLFNELCLNPRQDEDSQAWRRMHQKGVTFGHAYLERKWGIEWDISMLAARFMPLPNTCRSLTASPWQVSWEVQAALLHL